MGEFKMIRSFTLFLLAAAVALAVACGRPAGDLEIRLVEAESETFVSVTGFSSDELGSIGDAAADFDAEAWQDLMRVTVSAAPPGQPGVIGDYRVTSTALEFRPRFGFDPGREYDVVLDRSRVPGSSGDPSGDSITSATVGLAALDQTPTTRVTRVLPTAEVWPENHLRFYVEFSGPMSRTSGLAHVRLIDDTGETVVDPFLPLDVEFWNGDLTRYTLFLDPGRVKQGILPNQQMGRALEPGRSYVIEVDAAWRDEHGLPLVEPYRQTFTAGPADEEPVDPGRWEVRPPAAGSRDPLIVTFPGALDHGLLMRAVGVSGAGGDPVVGEVDTSQGETVWRFTPDDPWAAGAYDLVVLSILEDLAGNRVGRLFEVDRFDQVDERPGPEQTTIAFDVR